MAPRRKQKAATKGHPLTRDGRLKREKKPPVHKAVDKMMKAEELDTLTQELNNCREQLRIATNASCPQCGYVKP